VLASPVAERRSEKATAPLPGELLAELLALVGDVSRVLEPDALLPAIARNLRRIVDYRVLDIFLPDAEGYVLPAYVEGYEPELATQFRVRVGEGIVGAAAAGREPVFVPDVSKDPRYIPFFPGVAAEVAIPLVSEDHLVGVLNIEGPAAAAFTRACPTRSTTRPPRGVPCRSRSPACPSASFDGVRYDEVAVQFGMGDLIVFYTDGLVEARRGREEYGLDRLLRGLETHAAAQAAEVGERLIAELEEFLAGESPADDVTLIVVKML
jgi:putative methionine-R-sulfoxide reductase with GAF domain